MFALEGQEGRLFHPLAFTKTFAMAAASLLSVTLVPVAMGLFIRGRLFRKFSANPINRTLIAAYRPIITRVLRHRWPVISVAVAVLVLTWVPSLLATVAGLAPFPVKDLSATRSIGRCRSTSTRRRSRRSRRRRAPATSAPPTPTASREIYAEIDRSEKTAFEAPQFLDYRELYPWLLWPALGLLLLEIGLGETVLRKLP